MKVFSHFFIPVLILAVSLGFSSRAQAYANENATSKWQAEGYKPNYFLYGDPDSKLSLSLKIKVLEESNFYLAYSQLMFWELSEDSSPFKDVNYNPEIFYRKYVEDRPSTWVDVGIFEHESNGLGGYDSRGWNRFYLLYSAEAFSWEQAKFYASFKAWVPYNAEETNEDITEYRGLWELNLTVASFLGEDYETSDLIFRVYGGGSNSIDPTQGGQEITLRLKGTAFKGLLPVFTVQYFNGYGESLLSYNEKESVWRVGIGF